MGLLGSIGDAVSDVGGFVNDTVGAITPWNDDSSLGKLANMGLLAAAGYGAGSYLGGAGTAANAATGSSAVPAGAYASGGLASTAGSGGLMGSIAGSLGDAASGIGSWWGSLQPQTQLMAGLGAANTLSSVYENQKMRKLQKDWMEDTKKERERHRYSTPDIVRDAINKQVNSDNPGYNKGSERAVESYLAQQEQSKPKSAVDAIVKRNMNTWWG